MVMLQVYSFYNVELLHKQKNKGYFLRDGNLVAKDQTQHERFKLLSLWLAKGQLGGNPTAYTLAPKEKKRKRYSLILIFLKSVGSFSNFNTLEKHYNLIYFLVKKKGSPSTEMSKIMTL